MSVSQYVSYPGASLYVGDLHPEVTEAMLFEKFSSVGPVASLRICRDSRTNTSLGYGYVNFNLVVDAERAIDTMNFDLIKGKPMRIMWCQRDPALRKSGKGNVFIKNLDKNIDNKSIHDTFSAFGHILSCKLALDDDGVSKGYGFIHYDSEESANKAIEKVNGMLLNGKMVYVGKFMRKAERERLHGNKSRLFTNIYVKNFGDKLSHEELHELFAPYGRITSSVLMRDEDGVSRGFGFVAFEDAKSAEKAVEEINGKEVKGCVLYAGRAQKRSERMEELRKIHQQIKTDRYTRLQNVNLYVKNLDDSFDDDKLCLEFSKFGNITSAKVMRDHGVSKGFGFVCFTAQEEASKAIAEMSGKIVGTKPLYVGYAQRKADRRAFLNAQYMHKMRTQSINFPTTTPPFILPAIASAPRIFNQINHIRATPRWHAPQLRPNGAYFPIMTSSNYRLNSRPVHVNGARASGYAKGNNVVHIPAPKPNNKPNNNNRGRTGHIGQGNGSGTEKPEIDGDQKEMIGEKLFRVVEKFQPEMAAKITGMLLEIDYGELLRMIEDDHDSLKAKVDEAIAVLEAHKSKKVVVA